MQCFDCPAGKSSAARGMASPSGCTNCVAGKYATDASSTECTDCAAGKYSGAIGSDTSTSCMYCPGGSLSPSGSSSLNMCGCGKGVFGPNATSCKPCAAGTYKDFAGSGPCLACPSNSDSTEAAQNLWVCYFALFFRTCSLLIFGKERRYSL